MLGKVKWFNNEKGYGFIEYNDNEDIFFHYSEIQVDGYKTINQGEMVQYELLKTDKGLRAKKIFQVS